MSVRGWMPILIGALMAASAGVADAQEIVVRSGWLGFAYEDSREDARAVVRIQDVYPGSPAAEAGLRGGDEIIRWNGRSDVSGALQTLRLEPGDTIRLRIRRGDERDRDLVIVADRKPSNLAMIPSDPRPRVFIFPREQAERFQRDMEENQETFERILRNEGIRADSLRDRIARSWGARVRVDSLARSADSLHRSLELMLRDSLGPQLRAFAEEFRWEPAAGVRTVIAMGRRSVAGAEFEEMNPGLSTYFGTDDGALVLRVSPGTPAARAGLQPGDVVLQANDRAVDSVDDLRNAVARAQGQRPRAVELEILRKGERQEVDLRWE